MSKVLVKLSIPPRLRDGMLLKEGSPRGFDVPNSREGILFLSRWENTNVRERDALMKAAYDQNIPIHRVQLETTEDGA